MTNCLTALNSLLSTIRSWVGGLSFRPWSSNDFLISGILKWSSSAIWRLTRTSFESWRWGKGMTSHSVRISDFLQLKSWVLSPIWHFNVEKRSESASPPDHTDPVTLFTTVKSSNVPSVSQTSCKMKQDASVDRLSANCHWPKCQKKPRGRWT